MGPLHKEMGNLVTWDMDKAELLQDLLFLSFPWEVLQLHHPKCRRKRQGLGEWRTTHHRSGVRSSKEQGSAQVMEPEVTPLCVF